jgi:hypothetical protein
MKDESHRSVARAFLNTFPAGTPVTLPPLSSAERRSISSSHACSACGSAGSPRLHNEPLGKARPRARGQLQGIIFDLFDSNGHRINVHQKIKFWKIMAAILSEHANG